MSKKTPSSAIAVNKKARHLYELSEFLEAGISLTGPEVKSIRAGKVNFIDSYVEFRQGEAWLVSLHVAPYAQKGLTVVPVRLYFSRGKIKVEIALGRGKKLHDHRETLKRRAEERDMARELA